MMFEIERVDVLKKKDVSCWVIDISCWRTCKGGKGWCEDMKTEMM